MKYRALLLPIALGALCAPAVAQDAWEGYYAGLTLDGTRTKADAGGFAAHSFSSNDASVGLYIGRNYVASSGLVWGPELSLQGLSNNGTGSGAGLGPTRFKGSFTLTPKMRAGFTRGNVLFYGTLGLGITDGGVVDASAGGKSYHIGASYGLGMEYLMDSGWSTRIEANVLDLSGASQTYGGTSARMKYKAKSISFGIARKF